MGASLLALAKSIYYFSDKKRNKKLLMSDSKLDYKRYRTY